MPDGILNRGKSLLDLSYAVGASVTTYLAGAARPGLQPFRLVVLDPTFTTTAVGSASRAPLKYPNPAFANGEKLLGVAMGPENTTQTAQGYAPSPGIYYPILPGRSVDVRHEGLAPIMTDSTTSATPVLPGDFVVASTTANCDGLAKKGGLTGNAPASNQHIAGISLSRADISYGVALTLLRFQES